MSRKINRWITTLIFALTACLCVAQNQPIGTWTGYAPYNTSKGMCDAGNLLYCAAAQTVFSYNKTTGEIQTYDKSNGLNDVGIKTINYDPNTKFLVIAYVDDNIDLIYNGTDIYNLSDIQAEAVNTTIYINSISFNNGSAYLSTNIGITVIDLSQLLISNTYIIGSTGSPVNVNSTAFDGTNIYAATREGVKYAPLNSPNLSDFNNWTLYSGNLPTKPASLVAESNNNLYAVLGVAGGDTMYEYTSGAWKKIFYADDSITGINILNNELYLSIWSDTGGGGLLGTLDSLGNVSVINPPASKPLNWLETGGAVYDADYYNGLYKGVNGSFQSIAPAGPYSSSVFRMCAHNGVLDVAPGGVDDSWNFDYNSDGFFIYQNYAWNNQNQYTNGILANHFDILSTAHVASTGKTYFGSFFSGLIEYDDASGAIKIYDKNNSILEGQVGDTGITKISCLYTDANDNLWIGNAGAPSLLKVIPSSDGIMRKFLVPSTISLLKNLIIDENNQIWALTRQNNGVLIFSYGASIDDSTGFSYVLFPSGGAGNLPGTNTYSIAEDLDGNIWVGTDAGIGIFYCAANVLQQGSCDAEQIKVVAPDGYVAYLFGSEIVRAIAVDAANRKWIGTSNGAWLISADGQTQLLSFNSSNSPMPANQVTDIQIDNTTGVVYIGTIGGLVSYQGDAVATCQDCNEALVYPNPVKPGYTGPIAIKGLASNANVKITDVTGTLVYQGTANGEQMIWSGYKYNGERAKSGVYLVFSADDLGKERKVAKILIMN